MDAPALPDWPLFGLTDDVRPALANARAREAVTVLATIVALDGGGPRAVGAQMLFGPAPLCGFLSGGCLEADVAGHAARVMATGEPVRLVYGAGSPWPDISLLCGARIEILLERLAPHDVAVGRLLDLYAARHPAVWLTDGARRACGRAQEAPTPWPGTFVRQYAPVTRLIVLGADPTALAIAQLGSSAGFETTLVRPKGPPAPPPLAGVGYRREDPAEALAAIGLDRWTAVAVATHEMEIDHAALAAALPSPAFYVGALGARRRGPERIAALRAEGLRGPDIDRLITPIGLPIGGKAPFEIAVSVIGQILGEAQDNAQDEEGVRDQPLASDSTSTGSPGRSAGAPAGRRRRASAAASTVTSAES